MQTVRLKHSLYCPECKADLNATSGAVNRPVPGNMSVCGYCALPMVFTETLAARPMREDEFDKLDAATKHKITAVRMAILSAKAKREANN